MMTTVLSPIRMLVLTLTGRCNFACRYCYATDADQVDMKEETAIAALHLAGRGGNRFLLQFSGGEPLLRFPLIRKLVEIAERNHYDAQMQIQTNGSLLTKDIGTWLYRHGVGIGIPATDARTSWTARAGEKTAARPFRLRQKALRIWRLPVSVRASPAS